MLSHPSQSLTEPYSSQLMGLLLSPGLLLVGTKMAVQASQKLQEMSLPPLALLSLAKGAGSLKEGEPKVIKAPIETSPIHLLSPLSPHLL